MPVFKKCTDKDLQKQHGELLNAVKRDISNSLNMVMLSENEQMLTLIEIQKQIDSLKTFSLISTVGCLVLYYLRCM